ncbi:MAG: thymidine phosphorylase [Alphaproteobacteria bacterium]|nr:thymidine phosphorylase [Alphaproteobacteria bacterium]
MVSSSFFPQEIIRHKRDGQTLTSDEISFMIEGLVSGNVTESQISALAMAIFFQDMHFDEIAFLTNCMAKSGYVEKWDLSGPVLDKHSTGGVGDKVSLALAPMIAACGGYVPMISGRSLGHTGGTLDKLESIPGYNTKPNRDLLHKIVKKVGCAIIGQTDDLAPADKKFYSIRDITATVETIPLLTSSILSKKIAAGLEGLVMDIKFGNGAFLTDLSQSIKLRETIIKVAHKAGLPTRALLTNMNQVLGSNAGNSLEVLEILNYLSGAYQEPRLHEVTLRLGIEMLLLGQLAQEPNDARRKLEEVLKNGQALEKFSAMIVELGGPKDFVERPLHYLGQSPVIHPVYSLANGYITHIHTREIGLAIMKLGGGRKNPQDKINHRVGFSNMLGLGAKIDTQTPLALIHGETLSSALDVEKELLKAYVISNEPIPVDPLIIDQFE